MFFNAFSDGINKIGSGVSLSCVVCCVCGVEWNVIYLVNMEYRHWRHWRICQIIKANIYSFRFFFLFFKGIF